MPAPSGKRGDEILKILDRQYYLALLTIFIGGVTFPQMIAYAWDSDNSVRMYTLAVCAGLLSLSFTALRHAEQKEEEIRKEIEMEN